MQKTEVLAKQGLFFCNDIRFVRSEYHITFRLRNTSHGEAVHHIAKRYITRFNRLFCYKHIMKYIHHYESPLGGITMASEGKALTGLWFDGQKYFGDGLCKNPQEKSLPIFAEADRWLRIYFGGKIPDFTPPLAITANPFRKSVYDILLTIPYGQTMTYGEIAKIIAGQRGTVRMSAQAVGGAVSRNPVSIIVPCHRVIGAKGGLTGYAGGTERKAELLKIEGMA